MHISVEEIENVIARLPQNDLRKFRAWYEKFDADTWDVQMEKDALAGKLDGLVQVALADHRAGKSRKL